jgi:excisionase family DNA binding protein
MKKFQDAREKPSTQSDDRSADQISSLKTKLLLSVPEAAELLGVSKRTLFLLLRSGELTRRKVRRRTVIHRDDVIRFAARGDETQKEWSD